jgi:hypothetical protein
MFVSFFSVLGFNSTTFGLRKRRRASVRAYRRGPIAIESGLVVGETYY